MNGVQRSSAGLAGLAMSVDLNMTLPGRMKLSSGVMVLYADEESFT